MPSKKHWQNISGISVNTVETAYSILVQEGYLRAVARSGFYVCKVDIPLVTETLNMKKNKRV